MIKQAFCLLLSILFSPVMLCSAGENQTSGGRSAGLGSASVTLSDFWSSLNNQAGLGSSKGPAVGIYYENRFMVKELSLKTIAFVMPTNSGTFGFSFNSFGYVNYNEMKAGLAYGKKFGEIFSAGVQLDYLRIHIAEDYGNRDAFTFEVGIQTNLTKRFNVGAHLFNPIRVKLQDETDDRVPAIFKLGIDYKVSENLLIIIETEKNSEFKPSIRGGIEYLINDLANVRVGYSTLPSTTGSDNFSIASLFSFGFGLNMKKFLIDISSSYHQTLGWSPAISLVYNFRNIGKQKH